MMNIPLDKANLLGLFLETFLYGIFFTLFCLTLVILRRKSETRRHTLIPVASALLAIATAHLIVDFVRALQAFIDHDTGSALAYYADLAHPLEIVKTALYVTQTFIGDSVIVWRCYVVHRRSLYVLIPGVMALLMNAAAGAVVCWSLSQAAPGSSVFKLAASWITTFFVLTMCINVICTASIAWRIYSARRFIGGINTLLPVVIVTVESGALYACGVLAQLTSYLSGSNGQYPALDALTPLVGIVFSLIILQIHFHVGSITSTESTNIVSGTSISFRRTRYGTQGDVDADIERSLQYSMQPVRVHITEEREMSGTDNELDITKGGDPALFP
ncbi:hypothetical protein BJ138DRAFT_1171904 [Hygrophoropsis aurantiaca]|uniref:Uncharacterized protein n=1 Tax=Hygrophoropsis aurantiaca TaxID=72124 RepID=A0ACB8AHX4_9AGAM|nr:hypothetical protein BJ138DRAFT_1171904 [Hygrophoropsis aurantiaca]